MITDWKELKYWNLGDYQWVQEQLHDLTKSGKSFCPGFRNLFRAHRLCHFNDTRVLLVGQDPYPNPALATGLAFDIPANILPQNFPPTLVNFFAEYNSDLGYDLPLTGDLTSWCSDGVCLWNAYPSCERGKSLSHEWWQWKLLTQEMVEQLDEQGRTVFIFLGARAREFAPFVKKNSHLVIEAAHPSPRARHLFAGCRLFTRANDFLVNEDEQPIDWRL